MVERRKHSISILEPSTCPCGLRVPTFKLPFYILLPPYCFVGVTPHLLCLLFCVPYNNFGFPYLKLVTYCPNTSQFSSFIDIHNTVFILLHTITLYSGNYVAKHGRQLPNSWCTVPFVFHSINQCVVLSLMFLFPFPLIEPFIHSHQFVLRIS